VKIYYNPKLKQLARNLRNNSTFSEVLLWDELKKRKMLGYQFMRQKPIGNYIVDFFCSSLKLIIEIDGDSTHKHKLTEDIERQEWLEELGLTVLRFDDSEVKNDIPNVLYTIEKWIRQQEDDENNISN
jgi:very-short-patch-repair endonuclease